MHFFKKNIEEIIGDGFFVCSIPKYFITETEENGTLLIYNPKKEKVYYRVSFISFKPKDSNDKQAGEKFIEEDIKRKKLKQKKIGKYNVVISSEKQIENDTYIMKKWEFGLDNNIFILSVTFPNNTIRKSRKYNRQMEAIIKTIRKNEHFEKLQIEGNEIKYKEKICNQNQQIRDLTQEETDFINTNLSLGNEILNTIITEGSSNNELERLDKVFKKWLDGNFDFSNNEIAFGMGVLFGTIAKEQLGMEWKMLTDEYGTDYCLVHKKTNTIIFPISAVYKRVESKEYDFFWNIYQITKNKIEE